MWSDPSAGRLLSRAWTLEARGRRMGQGGRYEVERVPCRNFSLWRSTNQEFMAMGTRWEAWLSNCT
jgi:hypothetical protein